MARKNSGSSNRNDDDLFESSDGDDILKGRNGNDNLFGGLGNDTLHGNNGNDHLSGDDGDDELHGGNGKDDLFGGIGDDQLYGDNANDNLSGDDGNDRLFGGNGTDTLLGGLGDDHLDGGRGGDTMRGGEGDDTYVVDAKPDKVFENESEGHDTVLTSLNKYALGSHLEDLSYTGTKDFRGTGNELDNHISGGGGKDTLSGGDGNDTLIGNGGNDTLIGGLGDDILNGGDGADLFLLNALTGVDTIQDFTVGTDRIQFDDKVFADIFNGSSNTLDAQYFISGTEALTSNQHIIHDSNTGTILYDADGSGAGAAITIAQVTAGLILSSDDFQVI